MPTRRSSKSRRAALPCTTALELPGLRIAESLGLCFGVVVRSVGVVRGFTGGLRAMFAGEVPEFTEVVQAAREQALARMMERAEEMGADAVVAVRFDASDVGAGLAEIFAYGTAVTTAKSG